MRSLLNLVSGRTEGLEWQLSVEPGGDVTIVDVDSAAGRQTWAEQQPNTEMLVALTSRGDTGADQVLKKPLRSREFLGLLGRLAGTEFVPAGQPGARPSRLARTSEFGPGSSSEKAESGEPADGGRGPEIREEGLTLAEHLREGTWSGPIALTSPGWPVLLIDPCSGTWFFDGSIGDLDPDHFARPIPASAGVALTNAELVERVQGHRQRNLSELKWYAGLAHSPGVLHPALRGGVKFMLTQVPSEAMKNELLHDLARIVLRGPTDLQGLLEESGQPEPNVVAFLNACFCSEKLLVNRVESLAFP